MNYNCTIVFAVCRVVDVLRKPWAWDATVSTRSPVQEQKCAHPFKQMYKDSYKTFNNKDGEGAKQGEALLVEREQMDYQ